MHWSLPFTLVSECVRKKIDTALLGKLGAKAVGMITVLDAIAAKQVGASVVGLSCMTNDRAGLIDSQDKLDHADVFQMGAAVA
jgi:purine-nucleoside phosphorylase